MNPEAQQEAISREVGYYLISDDESNSVSLRHPVKTTLYPWHRKGHEQFAWEDAPDWLSDLNAMHEAEKVLTVSQLPAYSMWLRNQLHPSIRHSDPIGWDWVCIRATAAQRAEAFLRTLDKWTDSK